MRGSFLAYVQDMYDIPNDIMDVIRALIGDVIVDIKTSSNGETYIVTSPIHPVTDPGSNIRLDVDYIKAVTKYGTEYKQPINLVEKVTSALQEAYTAKQNKSSPPQEYEKYVKLSPIPLEHAMNYAVLTKNPAILYSLAPSVAQGIFYNALLHVTDALLSTLGKYKVPTADRGCEALPMITDHLAKMKTNAQTLIPNLTQAYLASLNELNLTVSLSSKILDFENLVKQSLAGKLSRANLDYVIARFAAGR